MSAPSTTLQAPLGNRPALDGLRAVAIISVVLSHSKFSRLLPGGGIGVDLFFVLSGFLITTLLAEEWGRNERVDIMAFYARRALRLGPALVVLLIGIFALSFVPDLGEATPAEVARFAVYVLTYTSNWVLALKSQHWPPLLGHLWSLAVEEQFYLLWPLLLYAAFRRRISTRTIVVALLLSVAALALWRAILWHRTHDVHRVYFATDCRASGLLLGSALGLLRGAGVRVGRAWILPLASAGLVLYLWTASHLDHQTSYALLAGLKLVEVASTLLLAGLAMDHGDAGAPLLMSRVLASAPMVWVGRRSYAIYLWHVPMLYVAAHRLAGDALVVTLAGVAMTLAITELSWRLVEHPALRHKRRFERRAHALAPSPA